MSGLERRRFQETDNPADAQSSDEKMDTGSGSQNTPNSVLSSDFEDRDQNDTTQDEDLVRLQHPIHNVHQHSESIDRDNSNSTNLNPSESLNNSLLTKMYNLRLNSIDAEEISTNSRSTNIAVGQPRCSTLMLTTNHPLMGLGSPDSVENFPDVVPQRLNKYSVNSDQDTQRDLSLSSTEDPFAGEANGFLELYQDGPQRNTSKNNLYISDSYLTSDIPTSPQVSPPDVARVFTDSRCNELKLPRKKIVAKDVPSSVPRYDSPVLLTLMIDDVKESPILSMDGKLKTEEGLRQSTPKTTAPVDILVNDEQRYCAVADWCESPSQLRFIPNFELPIEMSSSLGQYNDLESPDVLSSSTQAGDSIYQAHINPFSRSVALRHSTSNRLDLSQTPTRRRIIARVDIDDACSLSSSSVCSLQSEDDVYTPQDRAVAIDQDCCNDESQHNSGSENSETIPEYSAAEEREDERAWLKVALGNGTYKCLDMKVIEPFKRVLSHGGYEASGVAIIVLSACYLPDSARVDYNYVMDNLFLYMLWTLERLVTDEYVLVYLHGSGGKRRLPTFHWMHECYKLIDRRLRKSLRHMYLVHPTLWIKTVVLLTKPFISSKFFRKISYIKNLKELQETVPVESNAIPDLVKEYDARKR